MKITIFLCLLSITQLLTAQGRDKFIEINDSTFTLEAAIIYRSFISDEERPFLDSMMYDFECSRRRQQIKSIGGIPFGISREEALPMLMKKFGRPEEDPIANAIQFERVQYAGKSFDNIYFLFQSDGVNSYLNECIFIMRVSSRSKAKKKHEELRQMLMQKYDLESMEDKETEFTIYGGGTPPLWDGHWYTLKDVSAAVHLDVVKYDYDMYLSTGHRYGIRLRYGPYNYIQEEF